MIVSCEINGHPVQLEIDPGESLLNALRAAGYFSVKRGCETGDCGSCTVLLDGQPVNSCVVAAARCQDCRITTLEGLLGDPLLQGLQKDFVDAAAVQCGYCSPGMLISLYALLRENPDADEQAVRHALSGNLCRCTGYVKPVEAALGDVKDGEVSS
jgi:aerobic-type carbon monoxide dehydrogenase small subunit (CoxS/CutS family)